MPDAPAQTPEPNRSPPAGPPSRGEVVELARQVVGLAGAGLALPGGLRAAADEAESRRVRHGLRRLAERIERGESLGDAIADEGRRLPEHLAGIARAAERSGRPAEVLAESIRLERIGEDVRRQLLLRLAYPTALLCAFAALYQVLSGLIVGSVASLYEDFGVPLPALSRWVIDLARFAGARPWAIPAGIAAAIGAAWMAARATGGGAGGRIARRMPILGPLRANVAMAEFSGLLSLLIGSSLPLGEALRLAARGVRDDDLIAACDGAAREVEAGRGLVDASRAFRLYPAGFDRLLAWAEANGSLPDALRLACELYAARARSRAVLIGLFYSAAAGVIVVLGLLMAAIGLYLPILALINLLGGGGAAFTLW